MPADHPQQSACPTDVSGVHKRGGEYIASELESAVNQMTWSPACREMLRLAQDRNHWIVFQAGIEHAHNVADHLRDLGIGRGRYWRYAQAVNAIRLPGTTSTGGTARQKRQCTGWDSTPRTLTALYRYARRYRLACITSRSVEACA